MIHSDHTHQKTVMKGMLLINKLLSINNRAWMLLAFWLTAFPPTTCNDLEVFHSML